MADVESKVFSGGIESSSPWGEQLSAIGKGVHLIRKYSQRPSWAGFPKTLSGPNDNNVAKLHHLYI